MDIQALNQKIAEESAFVSAVRLEMDKVIIGQRYMTDRLLIGLLCNGHILLEGVPGLAKTLAIKTLAQVVDVSFSRIQFTPDLLPADVVGTVIYNPKNESFSVKKGPVFSNFVLADEINRAPAKVQSALLEAMQERQVTIGDQIFNLAENQSTYIPQGQVHRLANPGEKHLEIIEVQTGSRLDEDDIVRFEDKYGRG
jgi:MoxR-like ATPase